MKHFTLSLLLLAATTVAQNDVKAAPASAKTNTPPAATQSQPTITQQVQVVPGQLTGRLLTQGSRQPIVGHTFKLLDDKGQKVGEMTSANDGSYTTPKLADGRYTLQVREDLTLQLAVGAKNTIRTLDVVVPQGPAKALNKNAQDPSKVPAAPGGAAPTLPPPAPAPSAGLALGGVGTWAVAAGVTAAVAVPVAANNSGSDSENPVSTSGLGLRR